MKIPHVFLPLERNIQMFDIVKSTDGILYLITSEEQVKLHTEMGCKPMQLIIEGKDGVKESAYPEMEGVPVTPLYVIKEIINQSVEASKPIEDVFEEAKKALNAVNR